MNVFHNTSPAASPTWGLFPQVAASMELPNGWSGLLYLQGNGILAIQWCLPDGQEGDQAARAS